jgi:hypothetical protein
MVGPNATFYLINSQKVIAWSDYGFVGTLILPDLIAAAALSICALYLVIYPPE